MKLLLVGCGHLGSALLHAWLANEALQKIVVVQPSLSKAAMFKKDPVLTFVSTLQEVPADFKPDMIVLAVKPQKLHLVAPELSALVEENTLLVSFLAGVSVTKLATYIPQHAKTIRIMPNIALKIGQSVNLTYTAHQLTHKELEQIEVAFSSSGKIHWLAREELIDLLTPMSGSGPAYFFLMAEILVQITIDCGIEENIARNLIQQTFIGSAQLTHETNDFQALITAVASQGGVTEAALHVLKPVLNDSMRQAVAAALIRIKELA